MLRIASCLVLVVLVCAFPTASAQPATYPVTVSFDLNVDDRTGFICRDPTLVVLPFSSSEANKVSRRLDQPLPDSTSLPLAAGSWSVRIDGDGCWSSAARVTVAAGSGNRVTLPVWPVAPATGRLRLPSQEPAPQEVRVTFGASLKDGGGSPSGEAACPVGSNRAFLCQLPAADLDLRVSVRGFAPVYRWGHDLSASLAEGRKAFDLGEVTLRPGASFSGWLITESGEPLRTKGLSAVLVPHGLADATNAEEQLLRQRMTSVGTVSGEGFMQFHSLEPGEYRLEVASERYAEASVAVQIVERSESQLRHPITLRPPMTAEFVVDPPTDFHGGNWRFAMMRVDRYKSHFAEVADGSVSAAGWFAVSPVNPTMHLVKISDSTGQEVLTEMVDLADAAMPMNLEIGMVPIEGRVEMGDEPLPSVLWFGGRNGAQKIQAIANEQGEFATILPRSGVWKVDIESQDRSVKRKFAEVEVAEWTGEAPVFVDLDLPATRLVGRVIEEDGSAPRQTTVVYASQGSWSRHVSQRTDANGEFQFSGLDAGEYRIHAKSSQGQSQVATLSLVEHEECEVDLTLREQPVVVGKVVDDAQRPVPGAFVQVQAADRSFLPVAKAAANGEGEFEAAVPASTSWIHATVASPGRTLGIYQFPMREDERLLISIPSDGGTLRVRFGEAGLGAHRDKTLVFFRNGVPFPEGEVLGWASIHANGGASNDTSLEVPRLVPGHYEVCLVPNSGLENELTDGRDASLCAAGELANFGELELDLSSA